MPPIDWEKIVSDTVKSGQLDQYYKSDSPEQDAGNHLDEFRKKTEKYIKNNNISLSSVKIPEPPVERNIVSEIAAAGGRGLGRAAELTGAGLEQVGVESIGKPLKETGRKVAESEFLAPSESVKKGESGFAKRSLVAAAEVLPSVLIPGLVGSAIGPEGTIAGIGAGALGAAGATGLTFGAGTYNLEKERAVKDFSRKNPELSPADVDQQAGDYARNQALIQTVGMMALHYATAGIGDVVLKATGAGGAGAGVQTLRSFLQAGPKEIAKAAGKSYAQSASTFVGLNLAQAENERAYGMGEGPNIRGALDSAATAFWLTGMLGSVNIAKGERQKNKIINNLNSENQLVRDNAVEIVSDKIKSVYGTDKANEWKTHFDNMRGQNLKIDPDSPIISAFSETTPKEAGVLEKSLGAFEKSTQESRLEAASRAAEEAALEANPDYEAASSLAGEAASEAISATQFETESIASRKRAAGIPLDAEEENALAAAEQRLNSPSTETSAPQGTQQSTQAKNARIVTETPEQAQQGYDAYQPETPVNPASEYGRQQAEFDRIQNEAAEYNRLKNIPDKLPELPKDLRNADSLSRQQLLEVAKKYNIPTVNEKNGKAIGIKTAVKRFYDSELKRISAETRLRTPEEQARLDQLMRRTPERMAEADRKVREASARAKYQQAATDLENEPLKPVPGEAARIIKSVEQARPDRAAAIQRLVRKPARSAIESASVFEQSPPTEAELRFARQSDLAEVFAGLDERQRVAVIRKNRELFEREKTGAPARSAIESAIAFEIGEPTGRQVTAEETFAQRRAAADRAKKRAAVEQELASVFSEDGLANAQKKADEKKFIAREGEDVAVALPVMMLELSQGTAGRRLRNAGESYSYDADAGTYIAEPSSYPKWVQEDPDLSKAGRNTIERVAELGRTGGKMTDRQIDLWTRLKAAAQKEYNRNPDIQQGVEYDRLTADGYNFESQGTLLASDFKEGDSFAVAENGRLTKMTAKGLDENTGDFVFEKEDGGIVRRGAFDEIEPVATKFQKKTMPKGKVPFSKAQAPLENAADVRAELAGLYSPRLANLVEKNGLIKTVDQATAERMVAEQGIDPKRATDGRIEGFVNKDGQVHLAQGGIEQGQTGGIVAHELGTHVMRSGFVKEQAWTDVLEHSDLLLAKGDKAVTEARRRTEEAGTPDSLLREETVAYLSNIAPKHGIIRNLIAKLKQFMINKGLASKFFVSKLTAADLQALAQGAARAAIKGKAAPEWARGVDARMSASITPDLRVEATNKKGEPVTRPLTQRALAEQEDLAPVQEAIETRTEELRSGLTEGDVLARKIEEEAQKKISPRRQAQVEKDLLEQVRVFKKQHLQPEIQDMANEIFGAIDPEARRMTPAKETDLKATRAEIERLKAEGADIDPALETKVARLDRRRIGDMLPGEAQTLLDVAKEIAYVNKTKNKLLTVQRNRNADEMSNGIAVAIKEKPSKRYLQAEQTGVKAERGKNPVLELGRNLIGDPASTFKTIMLDLGRGNKQSEAYKLSEAVSKAQDIELRHRRELNKQMTDSMGDWQQLAESKAWNTEQEVNGRKLTSGEKVYLKYSLNDKNVSDSIEKMGYRKKLDTKATKMSRAEREAIKLTPEEQKVYDALPDYFESTYNILNPAHIIMKGWRLFKHEFGKYLPKSVSSLTLADELGSIIKSGSLDGTGVTLDRLGTLNVINLKDIFEIISRQRDIASKYAAYAPLVRDMNLIFRSPELRNTLQMDSGVERNGKSMVENYVDDLLRDLQGNKALSDSGIEKAIRALRTNAGGAILAFRATTPLMQTASYPMALTQVSAKNLLRGLKLRGGFEEAAQWNERAAARMEQGFDREMADNRNKRLLKVGMAAISYMDKATIGKLWSATKLQVAEETRLTGDDLLRKTGERFNDVLNTQPNYTVADRSMTMRTQSEAAKMLTMFSSAKSSVLNEIKQGIIIGQNTGDWSHLSRASAGLAVSAAMMGAIGTAAGAAFGKDKDLAEETFSRAAGSIPGLDVLTSMFRGYGNTNAGIEAVSGATEAFGRLTDLARKKATGEAVEPEQFRKAALSVLNGLSTAAGVPTENIIDNLGAGKRLLLGKDPLEQVDSQLRRLEGFDFEKRKAKVTRGKQGLEARAALSKLRAEFSGLDQEKVAATRRLAAAEKRIKGIDKELEGEVPAALRSRRERLREEIAERAVR